MNLDDIPVLWITEDEHEGRPTFNVGLPDLEWQGKPFEIPTIGSYRVEMGKDEVTTLTLTIPVAIRSKQA